MSVISPNHREGITAIDSITGDNFYVKGTESTGAINVNAVITPSGEQDVDVIKVGGSAIALGQTTMSASMPVTIASNQTALPVSQSGTWNINNISGTISLPTGASTAAKQPALGTAGTPSTDVITVQGVTSMTALKVDGTGGTFPISGTVAATQSGAWNITNISGTVSLPTGASTEATLSAINAKLVSGTDIGDVTVNNGAGASAVNIQDGGNTITVDGTVSVTGVSTAANQTSGAQLTQIVDAGGEAVTVTGGKLDVNATISGTGGGTSSIDDAAFTAAVDSGTPMMGFVTSDTVDSGDVGVVAMDTARNLKVIAQANSGVDIGDVTINNGAGAAAVNIQDGGNTITVDGTVAATQSGAWTVTANAGTDLNTSALLTSANFAAAFGTAGSADSQVMSVQGIASMTPVQVSQATASNLNATVIGAGSAGTANSGVVTVQGIAAMTPLLVTPAANSAINIAQVNGQTVNVGTGAAGTGTQRVTTSTDSTIGTVTTVTTVSTVTAVTAITNALPAGTNAIGKLAANSGVDIGDVDVTSAVTGTIDHGSNQDIDTSAEQITSTSFACKFGVTLRAPNTNTSILWIGNSDVTVGGTAATDGMPLYPGDSLFLPVTNSNIPYAIATANNQVIYWIAA